MDEIIRAIAADGMIRMTASEAEIPGSAPASMPHAVPTTRKRSVWKFAKFSRPCTMSLPPLSTDRS